MSCCQCQRSRLWSHGTQQVAPHPHSHLRGVEGPEGEAIEEVAGGHEPSHWPNLPAGRPPQHLAQVLQLRRRTRGGGQHSKHSVGCVLSRKEGGRAKQGGSPPPEPSWAFPPAGAFPPPGNHPTSNPSWQPSWQPLGRLTHPPCHHHHHHQLRSACPTCGISSARKSKSGQVRRNSWQACCGQSCSSRRRQVAQTATSSRL